MPVWIKYLITAGIVVLVSEVAKRNARAGALIGALPWITLLVMIWLFVDKAGGEKIASYARYTFWYVLPTLPMFLLIPWMLKKGVDFPLTLLAGVGLTAACLILLSLGLKRFGIELL